MAPGSFFKKCLPDSSVDIGTAWSSAHWLSRDPIPLSTDASPEEVLSKFCRHDFEGAHSDLVRFLKCRACETRPNGIFTACLLAHYTDETNQFTKNQPGLKMASIMARNQLIEEGKLSKELTGVVLPCHERSREEMEAAFEEVKDDWIVEEMKEDYVVHPASTWWIAIVGGMLTKIAMPKETAEAKKILDEFTERAAQVFLERSKDEPAMNKFWFLRLRRK
ncbi:SAM dependent carboxyl methyltransferase [Neofusicoccum parvum]|uniref:SAM dependent carboxyl methyltransferase n=1 Tax=Neofusicoccum parvum TaxID=310453 RepID=A0ACB5RUH4_9PEZI|nr:SAM dependent carboxyl methyltransferase [Neofusicoccum parvum]